MVNLKKTTAFSASILILGFLIGVLFTANLDLLSSNKGVVSQAIASDNTNNIGPGREGFADVAEKVMPTVVTVYSEQVIRVPQQQFYFGPDDEFLRRFFGMPETPREQPRYREFHREGLGSGVIVTSDGYILTNNHVIADADEIRIKINGKSYIAEIIGTDEKTDLAVLKIEPDSPLSPATLGDSEIIRVGQWVLAVGHPFNLDHTVTAGIISAKGRNRMGITEYEDFLQTDAAINPGNSGGALVNLDGELIGINTAIASRTGVYNGVGFAIPINMAKLIMDQLLEHGRVIRGWIGVSIQDINAELAEALELDIERGGALVTQILPDTPAEKAGIEQGDLIIAIDGEKIESSSDLRNRVASTMPETDIELTVIRDGREKEIEITLGELPGSERLSDTGELEFESDIGLTVEAADKDAPLEYGYSEGLIVTGVEPGSPASRAGLAEGDLIFEVNRKPVASVREYRRQLNKDNRNTPILLLIGRNGGFLYVAVSPE